MSANGTIIFMSLGGNGTLCVCHCSCCLVSYSQLQDMHSEAIQYLLLSLLSSYFCCRSDNAPTTVDFIVIPPSPASIPYLVTEQLSSAVAYAGGAGSDYDPSAPLTSGYLVYAGGIEYVEVPLDSCAT